MYGGGAPAGQGSGGPAPNDDALYAAAMMAAMQEQSKPKYSKYLESLLPLALLIVLGAFLAAKMGLLPGSMFGMNKTIHVLILTDDPNAPQIQNTVAAIAQGAGEYMGFTVEAEPASLTPSNPYYAETLSNYDVVILYQLNNKSVTDTQRDEFVKYVKNGGNLIIIKDSGTCDPEYGCMGWGGGAIEDMGKYMPVRCVSPTGQYMCQYGKPMTNVRLQFYRYNSELNPAGAATRYFPGKPVNVQLNPLRGVMISQTGERVAMLYSYDGQGKQLPDSAIAIALSHSVGLSNGTIAFVNFNPATKPFDKVFRRLIYFLTNKGGFV